MNAIAPTPVLRSNDAIAKSLQVSFDRTAYAPKDTSTGGIEAFGVISLLAGPNISDFEYKLPEIDSKRQEQAFDAKHGANANALVPLGSGSFEDAVAAARKLSATATGYQMYSNDAEQSVALFRGEQGIWQAAPLGSYHFASTVDTEPYVGAYRTAWLDTSYGYQTKRAPGLDGWLGFKQRGRVEFPTEVRSNAPEVEAVVGPTHWADLRHDGHGASRMF